MKARPRKAPIVPSVTASEGRARRATRTPFRAPSAAQAAITSGVAIQIGTPKAENLENSTAPNASVEASEMSISPRMTTTASPMARMPGKTNWRVELSDLVEAQVVGRKIGRPRRRRQRQHDERQLPLRQLAHHARCPGDAPAHAQGCCGPAPAMITSAVAASTIAAP